MRSQTDRHTRNQRSKPDRALHNFIKSRSGDQRT